MQNNTTFVLVNDTHTQPPLGFWYKNGSAKIQHFNKNKWELVEFVDFAARADNREKSKESEKKDKYPDFLGNGKKVKLESDVYTDCYCRSSYSHQRINTGTGGFENKRTSGCNTM